MTNDLYNDFVDLVDDMLEEYGASDAVYVQPGTAGTFNPATGKYTGATAATQVAIKAIFSPVFQYMVDGINVLASDYIIKVSPKGLTRVPVVGDKIQRGSLKVTILNTQNINPADTNILLVYHARKD